MTPRATARRRSIAAPGAILLAVLAAAAAAAPAPACTTVLVGRALTADGAVLHAHNEDMGNEARGRLWHAPAAEWPKGATVELPYVELPQASSTLAYWASGNAEGAVGLGVTGTTRSHDSVLVGMNERGVTLSCNWAHSREPAVPGRGIRRYALRQLLLERATSAKHGVDLLGGWIERYGQADWSGLVYHLADPREAWVIETTTDQWVARRVRDDEIRVTANRFRIGADYDLASGGLVDDAVAAGWAPPGVERIDFAAVYGKPGKMDQPYDSRREARATALLADRRGRITPDDLLAVLRDRYHGTPEFAPPQATPVWREDLDARPGLARAIATNLAQSSFVAQLRDDLPAGLGAFAWIGLGTPTWSGYIPIWAGAVGATLGWARTPAEPSDQAAWWVFRRLQRAADATYPESERRARAFWEAHERVARARRSEAEAAALEAFERGDPDRASLRLTQTTRKESETAIHLARQLLAELVAANEATPKASSDNREVVGRGENKDAWWEALPRAAWSGYERIATGHPWFEVYRVRPGVLAIYEPGQFEEVISYLVVGDRRALLFDTGLGIGDMAALVGELTDRPVVVLNSHTHYDHVGGNHAFREVWGTDLPYTRRHQAGRPNALVREFVGPGWIWKATPAGFSPETYRSRPFEVVRRVADGDLIDLGGVRLEVLLTPGHAPDALCLLDRARRLLWTGDTFYPATLYSHLPGASFDDYAATARRLAGLASEVDLVLPAHNEPAIDPAELVRLGRAFRSIRSGEAPWGLADGLREYDFGRFSVLVTEPPPWRPSDQPPR